MRYWFVSISNGYCGFDDDFIIAREEEPSVNELFSLYDYCEGGGGLDPYDGEEFDTYDDYEEAVCENIEACEISREEYDAYLEEGYCEK